VSHTWGCSVARATLPESVAPMPCPETRWVAASTRPQQHRLAGNVVARKTRHRLSTRDVAFSSGIGYHVGTAAEAYFANPRAAGRPADEAELSPNLDDDLLANRS